VAVALALAVVAVAFIAAIALAVVAVALIAASASAFVIVPVVIAATAVAVVVTAAAAGVRRQQIGEQILLHIIVTGDFREAVNALPVFHMLNAFAGFQSFQRTQGFDFGELVVGVAFHRAAVVRVFAVFVNIEILDECSALVDIGDPARQSL
jgi:hypothetical protein